jgi:hypothetical protein
MQPDRNREDGTMSRPLVATGLAALLALAGCIHVHEHEHYARHPGPPPHAPAHGYRIHHHDLDLRYDVHLGAYVVIGHPDHFFLDGRYYRRIGPRWERCGDWKKGRWKTVEVALVPVPLVRHYERKRSKHGKGKGHAPARDDD